MFLVLKISGRNAFLVLLVYLSLLLFVLQLLTNPQSSITWRQYLHFQPRKKNLYIMKNIEQLYQTYMHYAAY